MSTFRKVLITTSGTGSRLEGLTQYTNKSLVNIGGRAAIDHIIESYEGVSFVVTLGYMGELVKEYLSIAYPNLDIEYVWVDKFEGPGSSLLYSMSCAANLLGEPFIFHSCDTIIPAPISIEVSNNWIGLNSTNPSANSGQYRTVSIDDSTNSIRINEKGTRGDFAYIGLIGIVDTSRFWDRVDARLKNPDMGLSDAHVVEDMLGYGIKFDSVPFEEWLDTGNLLSLEAALEYFRGDGPTILEKPGQSVYVRDRDVIKFFSDSSMVSDRVYRAQKLGASIPTIEKSTQHFFSYEKVEGRTFTEGVTPNEFEGFLDWCWSTLWKDMVRSTTYSQLGRKFYYDKTKSRLGLYFERVNSRDMITTINGIGYAPVYELLDELDRARPEIYDGPYVSSFHGDLHNANIFSCNWPSPNCWKLIDWRENFAGQEEVGDIYYDLAKLNHGLIVSHDLVWKEMYTVKEKGPVVSFEIYRKDSLVRCQEVLRKFCAAHDLDWFKVEAITALIYLNIAPLHHSHYDKLLFYLGKSMLGDLLV